MVSILNSVDRWSAVHWFIEDLNSLLSIWDCYSRRKFVDAVAAFPPWRGTSGQVQGGKGATRIPSLGQKGHRLTQNRFPSCVSFASLFSLCSLVVSESDWPPVDCPSSLARYIPRGTGFLSHISGALDGHSGGKQEEWGTRSDQFTDAFPSFGQFTILSRDRRCFLLGAAPTLRKLKRKWSMT